MNTSASSTSSSTSHTIPYDQRPMLSIAQCADLLNCSVSHINKHVAEGNFPQPFKFSFGNGGAVRSNAVRFFRSEVQDWIDDKIAEATAGRKPYMKKFEPVALTLVADPLRAWYEVIGFLDNFDVFKSALRKVKTQQGAEHPERLPLTDIRAGVTVMLSSLIRCADALGVDVEELVTVQPPRFENAGRV